MAKKSAQEAAALDSLTVADPGAPLSPPSPLAEELAPSVPVAELTVADKRIRALKLLAPGQASVTNLNGKDHRKGLLAAMSSSDADGVDAWLARQNGGGDRLAWLPIIGYYVSPYERTDRKTGEVTVTDLLRLVTADGRVIHTHSSIIVEALDEAFKHDLLARSEPWGDIEVQVTRVKGESTYYQASFRIKEG